MEIEKNEFLQNVVEYTVTDNGIIYQNILTVPFNATDEKIDEEIIKQYNEWKVCLEAPQS
jgi:hypothetical protein